VYVYIHYLSGKCSSKSGIACHCGILVPPLDSDTCILMICRIAMEGDMPSVQLSALENMQYSHMVRFNRIKEAK
jgi:hypothetical protein